MIESADEASNFQPLSWCEIPSKRGLSFLSSYELRSGVLKCEEVPIRMWSSLESWTFTSQQRAERNEDEWEEEASCLQDCLENYTKKNKTISTVFPGEPSRRPSVRPSVVRPQMIPHEEEGEKCKWPRWWWFFPPSIHPSSIRRPRSLGREWWWWWWMNFKIWMSENVNLPTYIGYFCSIRARIDFPVCPSIGFRLKQHTNKSFGVDLKQTNHVLQWLQFPSFTFLSRTRWSQEANQLLVVIPKSI